MKILIVVPKYTHNNLTTKRNYHYTLPLGIGYIISVLKKAKYNLECINLNHLDGTIEQLMNSALDKTKYDIVCSGHFGIGYTVIEKLTDTCKSHPTKPLVIIGGPLITSEPKLMVDNLNFDFGIIGEGELTILDLLKCIEKKWNPEKVDGICFKKDGKTVFTKPRKILENLNSLPFPDFEAMGFNEQLGHLCSTDALYNALDYPRVYQVIGSRGCPFRCTFCYHTVGDRYRCRSVKNVVKEIRFGIKKYNINGFNLLDDLFASSKDRLKEFCKEIRKIRKDIPDFKWRCSLWVGAVDKEMLQLLKDSGCYCVGYGFESYSKKVLDSMKKPIKPEQIDFVIKSCFEMKIPIEGNFIFGDIAETKETARETLDYWEKNCQGQVQLHFIHPYPGSEIYEYCIKKGVIKDKLDFIKNKMHHTYILNMTENMTDKEFEELKKEIYSAKVNYWKYVVPFKISRTSNSDESAYDLHIKCPYCKNQVLYKNCLVSNKRFFTIYTSCKNPECQMRFYIVSHLYKITTKHYLKLDFLRRNYLILRDMLLKKRL